MISTKNVLTLEKIIVEIITSSTVRKNGGKVLLTSSARALVNKAQEEDYDPFPERIRKAEADPRDESEGALIDGGLDKSKGAFFSQREWMDKAYDRYPNLAGKHAGWEPACKETEKSLLWRSQLSAWLDGLRPLAKEYTGEQTLVVDTRQNVSNAIWRILKPQRPNPNLENSQIKVWDKPPAVVPSPIIPHTPKVREKCHPWCDGLVWDVSHVREGEDENYGDAFCVSVFEDIPELAKHIDHEFPSKWVTFVDPFGPKVAPKIKYNGDLMFNRDKIASEVCMAIPYYNATACDSCMERFGRKQNSQKGEYLPVGVPYPCPDCGVNNDFDDPGMTYNDTQASYASVRRRFEDTVHHLGLTTFGRKHLWLVQDKTRPILRQWKSEIRERTVTFPKPRREWGAWQYQMKEHKLDNIFSLGLGSMKGGQPSVFVVYVSEEWHLDAPRKIKAKENWGSVPRGEDADVMFAAKEKVDKLLFEPKSELPAWDDPEAITVT